MDSSAHPPIPHSASSTHQPIRWASPEGSRVDPQPYPEFPHPEGLFPKPIAAAEHEDGLQGLSGFQLHETVTRHLNHRRYNAALLTLAAGAVIDREASWFWHLQGEALANLGRYHEALGSFDHALSLAPERTESLVSQAVCYVHLQQYAEALTRCDRALVLAPHHSQAWLFRGVALQRLGQYTEAYHSYEQATPHPKPVRRHRYLQRPLQQGLTAYKRFSKACRHWFSQAF